MTIRLALVASLSASLFLSQTQLALAGPKPGDRIKERRAKAAAPVEIQAVPMSGKNLIEAFAFSCSADTYKPFAIWAKKNGFAQWQPQKASTFVVGKNMVTSKTHGTEVTALDGGGFRAKFDGKWFEGKDACDVFVKAMGAPGATKSALLSLLLPASQAQEKRVDQSSDKASDLGMALVGAALIGGLPVLAGGIVTAAFFYTVGAVFMGYGLKGWTQKRAYESILNSDFTLTCDETSTVIQGPANRIMVRKTQERYQVDVVDKNGKERIKENGVSFAPKAVAMVVEIAEKCKSPDDAAKLMAEFNKKKEEVKTQVEVAANDGILINDELGAGPGATGATAQ